MPVYLSQLVLAFLEGLALIISPCILSVLPIILSTSLTGGKRRPLGIICGFIIFFAIFTFFSRQLVILLGINLNIIRYISYGVLLLLGCVMLSNYLMDKFASLTQRLASLGSSQKKTPKGFIDGFLLGGLIGLIWTPCAGPILAAVIVQTILQKSNLAGFLVILIFSIGASIPMLLIALAGQSIINYLSFLKAKSHIIRRVLGVIIIISVVYLILVNEKGYILSRQPKSTITQSQNLIDPLEKPYPAPAITGISAWINSPPLTLSQLKGRVVLIDFWAYSCINCVRTFPYLKSWYQKYHNLGFEIIGVHSPEFDFEANENNVKKAVKNNGILYPVALDNQFVTWQNYQNEYWPADYLINKDGLVVYQHFGEGDYGVVENNIRVLLGLNKPVVQNQINSINPQETPETYLGYERAEQFHSPETSYPSQLAQNAWGLKGKWSIQAQKIVAMENEASIELKFNAKKVYAVMGSQNGKSISVSVLLNKQFQKTVIVSNYDLYPLLDLNQSQQGIIEIIAKQRGLEIYTFTFGD